MTVTIPRSCLKRSTNEDNLFSLVLPAEPANQLTCPIEWKPLDRCRKYKLGMSSQYSGTWNGPSSSWEIFTEQGRIELEWKFNENHYSNPWPKLLSKLIIGWSNYTTDSRNFMWKCPRKHFSCTGHYGDHGCLSSDHHYVCNGGNYECNHRKDEEYCDQSVGYCFVILIPL
jgi:hypothetical protein